jgi:medium-chain acyl-[acyl-carrier-protein] hydrolase
MTMVHDARDGWIVRVRRTFDPRLRLFAFPSAGRGPAMFRPWAAHMPPGAELCIAQLPGREVRWNERADMDVREVACAIACAMAPDLDRPYALFGHSLGALIAFEIVRQLRRSGRPLPRALFVAAHRAPQLPNRLHRIAQLPDADFLRELSARYGALPRAVVEQRELMELVLPTLKSDYEMAEGYEYVADDPLPCAISAFGGTDDRHVADEELAEWREQTTSVFVKRAINGGHFFVDRVHAPLISLLLSDLERWETAPRPKEALVGRP